MLRIASWNIELGKRLPLIIAGISRLPPLDVIALQELSEHAGELDAERIAGQLGPEWHFAQATAQFLRGQHQANGFIWNSNRITVPHVTTIALPTPSGRALRNLRSRRNAAVMEARLGSSRLRLYSVHLDVLGITHKHAQLARVLRDAHERPPVDLTVIAGDMNTFGVAGRPRWAELRRLAHVAGFDELTVNVGWTHRGLGVRQKLDAIFAWPSGIPHRTGRIVLPGSDHIPVATELDWA